MMTGLNDGTVVLENLLLLSGVKTEEPTKVSSDSSDTTVSAPSPPTMVKPVDTVETLKTA